MDEKERVELIRQGNRLFNEGKIEEAAKIFEKVNYIDGLIRVGDYYYFDKKRILKAFYYYKKAGFKKRLDEIYEKMANVIHNWLLEDKKELFNNMSSEEFAKKVLEELKKITKSSESKNVSEENNKNIKPYKFPNISPNNSNNSSK